MTKLELNLKFPDTIEYTSLFTTPSQFELDVELLKTYHLEIMPCPNQLTEILEYADSYDKKISYLFTKGKSEVHFTAFIGTIYFTDGMFFDFDNKTYTVHIPNL